ncbi:MAG: DNA double-strand break repair nuclease NurA [Candidatus Bathyarchaeia archaeon]|nr:DNA double-strand break repair nuclease NurA [Candidatus Bathyarchaeota archaeon]
MIEQIHYATTQKYNFLRDLGDLDLSERFVELSLTSMSEIRDECFQPWIDIESENIEKIEEQENIIEVNGDLQFLSVVSLRPIPDGTPVIAIDASCIKVGETKSGIICAVRSAVVWNECGKYRCLRIGPFPFHITRENRKRILDFIGQFSPIIFGSNATFLIEVQSQLCNAMERWVQMAVSRSASNSIILFDGSLSTRISSSNANFLEDILRGARSNSNAVISFSKISTIKFLGKRITELIARQREPCLLEISENMLSLSSRAMRLLGKIYVGKLCGRGYAFRIDIDRALPREMQIISLQRVLGNDLVFQGYPETLRLAHIFSTFTASDIIGIQRFLTKKYGLKIVNWPNFRRVLFGPFGTGGAGD